MGLELNTGRFSHVQHFNFQESRLLPKIEVKEVFRHQSIKCEKFAWISIRTSWGRSPSSLLLLLSGPVFCPGAGGRLTLGRGHHLRIMSGGQLKHSPPPGHHPSAQCTSNCHIDSHTYLLVHTGPNLWNVGPCEKNFCRATQIRISDVITSPQSLRYYQGLGAS